VLATLGAFVLLWQFRSVLLLFLLSLVIAAAVRPLIARLVNFRIPAGLALLLIYLAALAGIVLTFYLIGGQLLEELRILSNYLIVLYDTTYVTWQGGSPFLDAVVSRLPPPGELSEALAGPGGLQFAQTLFGFTQGVAAAVTALALIIVLSIYWSADQNHFERLWLSVLPAGRRMPARNAWRTMEMTIGGYVRSEFVQAILAGVLLGVGYAVMGLTYPVLLALLGGIAWLIPLVGALLITAAALLAGLASGGWVLAVIAVVYTVGILLVLEFIIEPRLLRRPPSSGMLVIILMLALVEAYGLGGFIIAPLLAIALQVVLGYAMRLYLQPQGTAVEIEQLEARYREIVALFENQGDEEEPEPTPPEITSILQRLERLLDETRQLAAAEGSRLNYEG
jgi:predicted PurR-regulated permease PerM